MNVQMQADDHVITGYNGGWDYREDDDGGGDSVMLEAGAAKRLAMVI